MKNIFIIGVGRSGTSLLQSMLGSHSNISFLPETQFFRKYVIGGKDTWEQRVFEDEKLKHLDIPIPKPETFKDSECFYKHLLSTYGEQHHKEFVGDKDPRLIDFVGDLKKVFPHSKVVHIIRDPRDVVLSRTKAAWSKKWPFLMHPLMYRAQMDHGRNLAQQIFDENYQEVYYEDLIENPEAIVSTLCDWIGVPFEREMLSFQKTAQKLVRKDELSWKKETMGEILPHNVNKWKNELTSRQIAQVEQICKFMFVKDRYVAQNNLSSWSGKLRFLHLRVLAPLFSKLYLIRIYQLKR